MIGYFTRSLGAHFSSGKTLYVLSVLGVALGVASVLSIQIINRSAVAAFSASVDAVSGQADLSVIGRTPTFPEELVAAALATRGVAAAWPIYRISAVPVGLPDRALDVLGIDFYSAARLPLEGVSGDAGIALTTPGWIAVTPAYAEGAGLAVGDSIDATSGSRSVTLVIGALVDFQQGNPLASRSLAVMDIAQAQGLLGHPGIIDQIDIQIAADAELADVAERLQTRLGSGVAVLTLDSRQREAEDLLGAFRFNLTALSSVSVLVGLFLVYSSTQAALTRRRHEFGVLRSLGASPGQVFGLILAEVTLLGAAGVAIGVPLGYGIAQLNVGVVSVTLTNLYLLSAIERIDLPWWLVVLATVIGLAGAIGGALLPAIDVSRKDTKTLLGTFTLHERAADKAGPLFVAAVGLVVGAVVWYVLWGRHWQPAGFALTAVLVVALPLAAPQIVKMTALATPVTRFGLRYGIHSLATRVQTAAVAVATLSIAIGMLVGITLMVGSFRTTLDQWIATAVRADVYIATPSWRGGQAEATIAASLLADLRGDPQVAVIDRLRAQRGYAGDRRVGIIGIDFTISDDLVRFVLLPSSQPDAFDRVRSGEVLISEPLSRKAGLSTADTVVLATPDGPSPLVVAGVYYDYGSVSGAVAMALPTFERRFGPGENNSLALFLAPAVDPDEYIEGLRNRYAEVPLVVRSNRRIRTEALRIFDQTFAVTRLLQLMSLLIAAAGITLTLLVLARERVSELSLYGALGATRRQIFRIFVGKGVGLSAISLVLGSATGAAMAVILIRLINRDYFGWTIQFHLPWQPLLWQLATILAAALAASVYPAVNASAVPATQLSREDA